jgi:hypothetical protein
VCLATHGSSREEGGFGCQDVALDEKSQAFAERDRILSERDIERTVREQVILDRDWAFKERDEAVAVKNKALEFKDAAMLRRDKVIAEQDEELARKREDLESRDIAVSEQDGVAQELQGKFHKLQRRLVRKVLWSYRATTRTPTGETPFSLIYRTEAMIPVEVGSLIFKV